MLRRSECQGWAWGTAGAWAAGRAAVWSLDVLGWRLPGVSQLFLLVLVQGAGGLLVAALQAGLLRRWGAPLAGWGPVTWLGVTLTSFGPAAVLVLPAPRLAMSFLLLGLMGIAVGCLGQWYLLRRAGLPPEGALGTLVLGWGIAAGLSTMINWAFLGALATAGPLWTNQELLLLTVPFVAVEFLLPGAALGFGTGHVVRRTLAIFQGTAGDVDTGTDGDRRRRVGWLLIAVALLAVLGVVGGVLVSRGGRAGLTWYESPHGVSFAYPAEWRAERSSEWFILSDPDRPFLPALVLFGVFGQEPASAGVPGLIGYEGNIRVLRESRWDHQGRPLQEVEYTFFDGRGDSWLEMRRRVLVFPTADGGSMALLILQAPQELYPFYEQAFDALVASIEVKEGTPP